MLLCLSLLKSEKYFSLSICWGFGLFGWWINQKMIWFWCFCLAFWYWPSWVMAYICVVLCGRRAILCRFLNLVSLCAVGVEFQPGGCSRARMHDVSGVSFVVGCKCLLGVHLIDMVCRYWSFLGRSLPAVGVLSCHWISGQLLVCVQVCRWNLQIVSGVHLSGSGSLHMLKMEWRIFGIAGGRKCFLGV